MKTTQITAKNKAAWDASAAHHGTGTYWDELCTGFGDPDYSRFDAPMTQALVAAGIQGAKVLQIGCNNGRETLSACALGAAQAWGLDQSPAFLAQARQLQAISGHPAHFLEADIYALPETVPQDFDLIFITIGVLNWMPDLPAFFRSANSLLRPGGRLVIYETHPFLEIFEPASDTPFLPAHSYFKTDAFIESVAITYDGTDAGEAPESHWFVHTLGHIVNAVLTADLRLTGLTEYPHSIREVDYDIYQDQDAQLPLSFLLTAEKP